MAAILAKTVGDTYGDSYNYEAMIYDNNKTFCNKFLRYCCNTYCDQHILFILVCDKYLKSISPSWVDFDTIYSEFVKVGSPREINIGSPLRAPIDTLAKRNPRDFDERDVSNLNIFNDAIKEVKRVIKSDTIIQFKRTTFVNAFRFDKKEKQDFYDSALKCLKSYGIDLYGVV